jgi:hypothetical protein
MSTEKRPVEARLRDALHAAAREAPLPPDFATSVADTLPEGPPAQNAMRRFALPAAAAAAGVLVVVLLASALQRPEGPAPGAEGEWGPLAVVASSGGDEALAVGTLHISSDCVVLEEAGNQMTVLVWPADRTNWDAATRNITFVNLDGQRVTLADGDRVTFVGGGDSTEESGLSGEAWRNGMEWIAPPADGCPLESRWSVGEVVTGEGAATDEDEELIRALIGFARSPGPETIAALPFAEGGVWLGLGDQLLLQRVQEELADPQAWVLQEEYFRAYVGPFSALDQLARAGETVISVGPHPHCASPPVPPPIQVADLRRVSVQPRDTESCLQWWTVDLFLTPDGKVAAVTLDLWEP